MPTYIEREDVEVAIFDAKWNDDADENVAWELLQGAQRADVVPVRHGEWLNFTGGFDMAECSWCGNLFEISPDEKPEQEYFNAFKQFYRFCPCCGATMGKQENAAHRRQSVNGTQK